VTASSVTDDIFVGALDDRNDRHEGQPLRRASPLASIAPMRRLRWILLLVVALVIAVVAAAAFLVRPGLDDDRDVVDARWTPLRPSLIVRYEALDGVATALAASSAADRAVTKDLQAELDRWKKFALRGPRHTDPGAEAMTANELEALARRVKANVAASAKLSQDEALKNATAAFDQAVVTPAAVAAYNRAVRAYEDERSGFFEKLVAGALGYDSRPLLVLGT